jgi:hypothetical protein
MSWRPLHWLTVISMCHASWVYAILPLLLCWILGRCFGNHWYTLILVCNCSY